jgi:FAD/FMN-containing dehydrogenase
MERRQKEEIVANAETVTAEAGLEESSLEAFRARMRGEVLIPGDAGYDEARRIWNGMFDRRPAVIARCTGAADVIAAVNFARDHTLELAVRGGGHSLPGQSVCEGGMMIDLSPLNGVRVDLEKRTVRAGGGCLWGAVDHETAAFGLATVGGTVSHTGIGGLSLGGGFGWLGRKYGFVVDNIVSVDIVTADGRLLTASADENPDLFWAVRGGGGNFGVVTSFEYRVHEVGPIIVGGLALFPAERAAEILRAYREIMAAAPDELTLAPVFITAPPAPFVPPDVVGKLVLGIAGCYAGPVEDGQRAMEPVRALRPAVDLLGPMPYVALQTLIDEANPHFIQYYNKGHYLNELSDEAIDTFIAQAAGVTSPLTQLILFPFGGAAARCLGGDTAFGFRHTAYILVLMSVWLDPAESERHIQWTRDVYAAMRPFASGNIYVNDLNDEGPDQVATAYEPATLARLIDIKTKYDPENLFHMNQNIKPRSPAGVS